MGIPVAASENLKELLIVIKMADVPRCVFLLAKKLDKKV